MSLTYAQLGKSAIVTYELVRRDIFAEEKITRELLGKLATDIVSATGYEGEYVIKLWRTIDEDPFRQQNKIDVCADVAPVRHGHFVDGERKYWIGTGDFGYGENGKAERKKLFTEKVVTCSCCGKLIDQLFDTYCGNCGAKMDEEETKE